jgi:prefoldin subunit 5
MSTIEERVRDLEGTTQVLQATRVSWYARLDALEERIGKLEAEVNNVPGFSLADGFAGLQDRIEALEDSLDFNGDHLAELTNRVIALEPEEAVPNATAQAEDVEELRADIKTMYARLDKHRDKILEIESALARLTEPDLYLPSHTTGDEPDDECTCWTHDLNDGISGSVYDAGGWRVPDPGCPVHEPDKPKPNTEPSELLTMVRDRAIDPMYEALGAPRFFSPHRVPHWRGTNAYAEDAIHTFANWLDAEADRARAARLMTAADRYAGAARHVRAQLEP